MKTEEEIQEKIEIISSFTPEAQQFFSQSRYDVPWLEVAKYGELLLKWVLGELKEVRYCTIHRHVFDSSNGGYGCEECQQEKVKIF